MPHLNKHLSFAHLLVSQECIPSTPSTISQWPAHTQCIVFLSLSLSLSRFGLGLLATIPDDYTLKQKSNWTMAALYRQISLVAAKGGLLSKGFPMNANHAEQHGLSLYDLLVFPKGLPTFGCAHRVGPSDDEITRSRCSLSRYPPRNTEG